MKKFIQEFKSFAMKGNVIDLAVGIIIGASFGKIVSSLVNDLLMPILGSLTGKISIAEKTQTLNGVVIKYGAFIQSIVDFVIIALCIFILIKFISKFKQKEEEKKEELKVPSTEELLLSEIRDILKESKK